MMRLISLVGVLLLGACRSTTAPAGAADCGSWREGPALLEQRESSPTFALGGSRVLIVAGHFDNRTGDPIDSSEIVDVRAGTSTFTGSFRTPHTTSGAGPTLLLSDGRVLSGSPWVEPGATPIPSEIWDPATGEWSPVGAQRMPTGIGVLLPDGSVLVAGGLDWGTSATGGVDRPISRAERFDPATGEWTQAGAMSTPRTGHALVVTNGSAYAFGGFAVYPDGAPLGTTERFDASSGAWHSVAAMAKPQGGGVAVVLADGRILMTGGTEASGGNRTEVADAQLYDPERDRWEMAAPMHEARALHRLTVLRDGRVLATGGAHSNFSYSTTSAEIFEPSTGTWSETAPMEAARRNHHSVLLDTGEALMVGGYPEGERSTESYTSCR